MHERGCRRKRVLFLVSGWAPFEANRRSERSTHLARVRVTVPTLLRHRSETDGLEARVHGGADRGWRRRLLVHVLEQKPDRRCRFEWKAHGQDLIEDDPHRIQI